MSCFYEYFWHGVETEKRETLGLPTWLFFFLKRIPFYNGEYVRFEFGAFFWCCAVLKEVLSGVYV